MSEFAVLHAHTEFSTRDSLIRADELPRLAADAGYHACAITDHGGVEGSFAFVDACRAVGVKPIVGCEIYVKLDGVKKNRHLTVLCKNAAGFSSLLRLLSYAHEIGWDGRRRAAAAPINYILNNLRDCIVLSGCASSPLWADEEQDAWVGEFVETFGDDFYFEVQPIHDWDHQPKLNARVFKTAAKYERPVVVTPDCHFATPDEYGFHEGLLAIGSSYPVGHEKAWRFSTKMSYFMDAGTMVNNLHRAGTPEQAAAQALMTTHEIGESVEDWSWDELPPIKLPTIEGDMRVEAYKGLADRGPFPDGGAYVRRLDEELAVFEEAGLGPYLLLVRECVEMFKREGACIGPRGSVGGSLVGYTLGLCELDPIKHGLPWQRFYAPGRRGWPDVDIDIDDRFRVRVPDVLRGRFGDKHVAQLSTYTTFGMKQSIRDAARAFAVDLYTSPFDDPAEDPESIEEFPAWQKLNELEPFAALFAAKLHGRTRQFGAHPGGFVITADPVTDGRGAIVNRSKDKALLWDMNIAEKLGYVKLDFLGNASLSTIKRIEVGAGGVEWEKIPLDDPDVLADFGDGHTAGIPQFLTPGLRTFVERLSPKSFDDLVWANAAFRPGGLGTMGPAELVNRYRKDPGSVIVFQEDVMQMCVGLAGFTWGEADAVRKVVAKSRGTAEFEKYESQFVAGCVKQGTLSKEDAAALWDLLKEFGRYAFCQAHAASYTWNGYKIAWAKRHHPVESFVALLNVQLDKGKHADGTEQIIDEAMEFGVETLPGHVNHSTYEWTVDRGKVRAPLQKIPAADMRIAKAIMRRREKDGPFKDVDEFKKRMGKIKYTDVVTENAFRETNTMKFAAEVIAPSTILATYPERILDAISGQGDLRKAIHDCELCELRATCRAPVPPELNDTNVLIVGEAPGGKEDRFGKPFIGDSGKLLMDVLEHNDIRRSDVSWTNSVHCRPPYTKGEPTWVDVCPWLGEEIKILQPPLALAVGRRAWQKLGGTGGILKANATVMPGLPTIVACVHPAAVLRDPALLPEINRAVRKFARLYRELMTQKEAAHA